MPSTSLVVTVADGTRHIFRRSEELVSKVRLAVEEHASVTAVDLKGREVSIPGADIRSWTSQPLGG